MNIKINNRAAAKIKILVAPLDWGLGHATRCIPIIKELLNQKCEVWIAASGAQMAILKEEFSFLAFVELPGYGIKYGKNRALTILRLIGAFPKILIRIKRERAWLRAFQASESFDAVLSDNRYGLYCPGLFSVFMTHQLQIKTPFGQVGDRLIRALNYRAIGRFSRCWVPDLNGDLSLAGELAHPGRLPAVTTRYTGWLSRCKREEEIMTGQEDTMIKTTEGTKRLLVLLSGPEPQRTILENKILQETASWPGPVTLLRGLPGGGQNKIKRGGNLSIHDHLPATELSAAIRAADWVIARAGYSTIMDLMTMGKKAVLIPTPGQTEQEYLSGYLQKKRWAFSVSQKEFSLVKTMKAAGLFAFDPAWSAVVEEGKTTSAECLRREVGSLLQQLGYPPSDLV